jgi:hypothetical protein
MRSHLIAGEARTVPPYDGGEYFEEIDTGWKDRNKSVFQLFVLLVAITSHPFICRSTVDSRSACGVMDIER